MELYVLRIDDAVTSSPYTRVADLENGTAAVLCSVHRTDGERFAGREIKRRILHLTETPDCHDWIRHGEEN